MIQLYQLPPIWGLTSLSPFCIKVEALLKLSGIPYEVVIENNPNKAPKGKLPFIKVNQQTIADSQLILEFLEKQYDMNQLAVPTECLAKAEAYRVMLEEGFYFILLYNRWIDPIGFSQIKKDFPKLLPPVIGNLVLRLIQRNLKKQAYYQGISRHTQDEVYKMGSKALHSFSQELGKKNYFFSEKISSFDASIYAFLITLFRQPMKTELKLELEKHQNLLDYMHRLNRDIFNEQNNSH